jgi:Tfp pilus assembly protein PilZ
MVRKRKFDAVIVECDKDGGGLELLQQLRSDSLNQGTIAVGVVDDYKLMKEAFATGANFVLSKPVSAEDAGRILRFTRGMIGRMVRRFLRIAVQHLSNVQIEGMPDPAFILDLSEGGIAIQSLAPIQHGEVVRLTFELPATQHKMRVAAKVVWNDPTGRIGMEFEDLSESDRAELKRWIEKKLDESPEDYVSNPHVPAMIRVVSRWMRPLAVAIDGACVSFAAGIFCLIAFVVLRGQAIFPVRFTYFLAFTMATVLYSSLFWLMNVRFPGTRAVETLLTSATNRQSA